MIDPAYTGQGESPSEGIVTASKPIALQLIANCGRVDLLTRAWDEVWERDDWRMAALNKRIGELVGKEQEDGVEP